VKRPYKLDYRSLKKYYNTRMFNFKTTDELEKKYEIIGQERAGKAMEFGLNVRNPKYNIFVCGVKGTGKTNYSIYKVKEKAKKDKKPDDWCYVYNFKKPEEPKSINLPAGMGNELIKDIEELISQLISTVSKAYISEEYEKSRNEILKYFKEEQSRLIDFLENYSKEMGFEISNTSGGLIFVPIKDGDKLKDDTFEQLSIEEKEWYENNAEKIHSKAVVVLKKLKLLEKEAKQKVLEFQKITGQYIVKPMFEALYKKYRQFNRVIEYLHEIELDIVDNIMGFQALVDEENITKADLKNIVPKYFPNLIVDNENLEGAPVIVECNPTYNNLLGLVEYENENGTLKTDFSMIKAGALHRANGGYLIIQGESLLRNEYSWRTLKRVLNTGEIKIENLRQQLGITDIATLDPEPIPIVLKVIIIGSPFIYNLLSTYDDEFEKMFKIKVDFDTVMDNNYKNQMAIAQFISHFCKQEGLKPFDKQGVLRVFEYSNRIAGSQKKLSTRFNKISEVLIEADAWAEVDNSEIVTYNHVEQAISEKRFRHNKIEDIIDEMFKNGKMIIEISGKKVGKINGLSIVNVGDYSFGKPNVITASTYPGNKGVINIEREVDMSGNIHDKGVMILEGYLNETFCKEEPLNITSKICFEQLYSEVDGDSASSTELYAVLSSIGEIPLRQDIAVTGSINQKGEIQPVGGITEKIEGFYNICKHLGFTKSQGVIIPIQNVDDLTLSDEVIESVKKGTFFIFPISNIKEGLEILAEMDFKNICEIINEKLEEFRIQSKENGVTG